MTLGLALAITVAGGLGSLSRFGVAQLVGGGPGRFPWATLAVNVVGAAALGAVVALAAARPDAARWRAIVGVGFLGGFTTFSTFAVETVALLERRAYLLAATYVAVTLVVGIGACALAWSVAAPPGA